MKTIGIIGGVAWPSSVVYYQKINEAVARRLGGLHCARMVLAQTDFETIEQYQRGNRWGEISVELSKLGNALERAGADAQIGASLRVYKTIRTALKNAALIRSGKI